jgi:hypothetical protein
MLGVRFGQRNPDITPSDEDFGEKLRKQFGKDTATMLRSLLLFAESEYRAN